MTLIPMPMIAPRSETTLRSLDALLLLRPARASAAPTTSRHASMQAYGTSAACRAARCIAALRAAFSSSVSRGSFIAAEKTA